MPINDKKEISMQDYVNARFNSVDTAAKRASEVLDVRLESMNEFREQMKDQAATFVTRMELDALNEKIETLNRFMYMGLGAIAVLQVVLNYLNP